MLKELTLNSTVYLVTGYSDLRKGIEGLAAVVQGTLSLDPFNKSLYLFCGRRRDRIKGLLWEGDGFLLLYKRLDTARMCSSITSLKRTFSEILSVFTTKAASLSERTHTTRGATALRQR